MTIFIQLYLCVPFIPDTCADDHYLMLKWKDIESSQDIVIVDSVVAAHITMVKDRANLCNVSFNHSLDIRDLVTIFTRMRSEGEESS